MEVKIIRKLSVLLAIAATATSAAYATDTGTYFGIMLGQSNLHTQSEVITSYAPNPGLPTTFTPVNETIKPSGTGIGGRFFIGYNMNRYAAIESGLSYAYASSNYNLTYSGKGTSELHTASWDIFGKGMLPIMDSGFGLFGKLGGMYIKVKGNPTHSTRISDTGFRPAAALGASYDMTQNWVVDLSYTSVRYSTAQIKNPSFIALGISYHVLDPMCGQFLC